MSVIQNIRDKYAGFVIAFIALSLIAFILMDAFSGRGGGSLFGNSSTIGKVNGEKIDKRDFDRQIETFKTNYNMANAPYDQLVNRVWDISVDNIIMQDEYEKLGLAFTPKELNATLFGNNPPYWLKQNFTDPNTGEYNPAQAAEYFKQIKAQKSDPRVADFYEVYIKQQTIDQTLRQKYLSLISNSAYVPKWLAEKTLADQNAISSISYVYVPYNSISDSSYKATDDEIKAYVKKHPSQFMAEEETRTVSYVTFDVKPNAQDSQAVLTQISQYKNEFATTPDSLQGSFLERVGSEMPFYNSYLGSSRIQHAFKDSIANAGVGNVYGPYMDGNNYVFAKLLGTKSWPDSATVRHILIKTGDPRTGQVLRDDSSAKKKIDSIQFAIQRGANFDSLVLKLSEDEGSNTPDKKGVYDYFAQGQMVETFNDFAFDKPVGSKGVVKTEFGYHYMEVLGQKNFQPAYKIAYLAKSVNPSQETVDAAMAEAQRFASASRSQKQYNESVARFNKQSLQSMDIRKHDATVGGIGENRAFVRWVYENEPGDVSEPFDMKDKFIVAMVTNIQEKGTMNVTKARPLAEPFVINEKKAKKIIADKFKGNTLESYSQSAGVAINRADSINFTSSFVPGVGMEAKVIGTAFNRAMINKVSEPIAGNSGVFGLRVEVIGARPSGGNLEDLQKTMSEQLRSSGFGAINALKKAATIKDNRFDFF